MPEIIVKNISKKFKLTETGSNITLRDQIVKFFKRPFYNTKKETKNDFWALRDINFEVNKGDVVGLIGKNGAGKSTLLKIISRILLPTEGEIIIKGKVASLLEVGTGFHPELTGRENIFLNSSIYRMPKREIKEKFDEIVEFSGVSKFMNTPIKFYSNGMYMRLAFAVAAHIDSDILLIDEVLSVGDYEFQKKCLTKINNLTKDENRTIIFVSHNMEAIKKICKKTILLTNGRIEEYDSTDLVVKKYLRDDLYEKKGIVYDYKNAPGNHLIKIKSLLPVFKNNEIHATIADPVNIECKFWSLGDCKNINLSLRIYNQELCVLNSISPIVNLKKGLYKFSCLIPGNLLNNGKYFIKMVFSQNFSVLYDYEEICSFILDDKREINWFGNWAGAVRPKLNWEIEAVEINQ
jgi:lipopolysaccharide transport system ATP-binding protein